MSANVETMFYTRVTPWHGLGTRVEEAPCAKEALALAGLDWRVVTDRYKVVQNEDAFAFTDELLGEGVSYETAGSLQGGRRTWILAKLPLGEAARRFLHECCHGERSGIAVLSLEEQQLVFRRLTPEGYAQFREKQRRLFGELLKIFGVRADSERIGIFTNLCLAVIVTRRAIPDSMPLFVPEAADETLNVQIDGVVDWLESLS